MAAPSDHPLAAILARAVDGSFPPVDGAIEVMRPDRTGTAAVVELTGRSFVLSDLPDGRRVLEGRDGFGGATHPAVLLALVGDDGRIGSLGLVVVRRPGDVESGNPVRRPKVTDRFEHDPRVVRARRDRSDVEVLGDERGLVCIGRGLAGRSSCRWRPPSPAVVTGARWCSERSPAPGRRAGRRPRRCRERGVGAAVRGVRLHPDLQRGPDRARLATAPDPAGVPQGRPPS